MFFNPGEIESLLDAQTNPLVWLDPVQIQQIADDFGHERGTFYQKCPMCAERMSHVNFGGRSGVILDRCGTHGIWMEGSKLRRLTEWWRAGGKLAYQQHETNRVQRLYGSLEKRGTITSPESPHAGTWSMPDASVDPFILIDVVFSAPSAIFGG
jgi:Zn-finger nucleic acid-binding protein